MLSMRFMIQGDSKNRKNDNPSIFQFSLRFLTVIQSPQFFKFFLCYSSKNLIVFMYCMADWCVHIKDFV